MTLTWMPWLLWEKCISIWENMRMPSSAFLHEDMDFDHMDAKYYHLVGVGPT